MGTKTVSPSRDAYGELKGLKRENESFSDVVRGSRGKSDSRTFMEY